MKLPIITFITPLLLWFADTSGQDMCMYYRGRCYYPPGALRPQANEYNYNRIMVRQEITGDMQCYVITRRSPTPIPLLGTMMRIIGSPRTPCKKYISRLDAEYKVKCDEDEIIYMDVICFDLRGRDCPVDCGTSITIKCRDFIQIYPGYAGPVGQSYTLPFVSDECDELEDECGSTLDIDNLLATNQYYVLFRVGKENEEGERFVRNPGTDEYYKGFQIYSICVRAYYYAPGPKLPVPHPVPEPNMSSPAPHKPSPTRLMASPETQKPSPETEHPLPTPKAHKPSTTHRHKEKKIKTGCIERSGRLSTEVFPEYAALFELNEDLDNFHREWQRMRDQKPETELVIIYILRNQTVNYMDNTIYIFDNGTKRYMYEHVKSLKTFDSTGATAYHVNRVKKNLNPHFRGPGPLVIVCNCAFFQLFDIDPRGIVPNEAEKHELKVMYTPFLDIVDQNEDVYDLDYSGNYSHDSPTVDSVENGTYTEAEKEAISTAHINRDACNFVLRAQANATLYYYSKINDTLVESLRPFTMDCAVTHTHRRDGHCVTELRCISQPDIVEEKTTCRVNDELPFPCDPFPGPFEFSEKNDYISVTAINIRGRKARVVLSSK